MRKKSIFYRLTLGLLIGAMIMPAQPAQAQFGFNPFVYDRLNHQTQIQRQIAEAERYVNMFDNAVRQFTTLRGVLGGVEDLVGKENNAIRTMVNVGRTIRASLKLKDQVEAIITTRLTMLKSIDDRLRRGIFDPEADMRDFENYLKSSIGRSRWDSVATLERMRKMDKRLERLNRDLLSAQAAKSVLESKRLELMVQQVELISSGANEGDAGLESVNEQISNCDKQIQQYEEEIKALRDKIDEHVEKYYVLMEERSKFAEKVSATNKGWTEFNDALDRINRSLNKF